MENTEENSSKIIKEIKKEYEKKLFDSRDQWKRHSAVLELKILIKKAQNLSVNLNVPVGENGKSILTDIFGVSAKYHISLLIEIMEELVKAGADINYQDVEGNTMLHYIAGSRESKKNGELLKNFLSNKNLNLKLQNCQGQTALEYAIAKENHFAAEFFHEKSGSNLSFEEVESEFFSGENHNFFVCGLKIVKPLDSLINTLQNWDLQ